MMYSLKQFNALRPFGGFYVTMADQPGRYEMRPKKDESRRIEVFRRQERAGWSNWGHEAQKLEEAS